MTEEIWRPIVGYEGLYEVSSYGRVRSLDKYVKSKSESYRLIKGKILIGSITKDGYARCLIRVNGVGRSYFVHKLVADAFLSNPDNLPEVNHRDEDKINNRVDNLEWCDHKYNMNYGTRQERFRNTMLEKGHWTGLSKEEYMKKYYQENREKKRELYEKNREKIIEKNKEYYEKNKEKRREYDHQYYQENRENILIQKKEYRRKKKAGL